MKPFIILQFPPHILFLETKRISCSHGKLGYYYYYYYCYYKLWL